MFDERTAHSSAHSTIGHSIFDADVKTLDPAARRALRARAHRLHPVVMVGGAGLTDTVLNEIDRALSAHELIKIRMLGEARDARKAAMERICLALDAAPVQVIGKILIVFRPKPEEAVEKSGKTMPANKARRSAARRSGRG